jgi:hypothetical protein
MFTAQFTGLRELRRDLRRAAPAIDRALGVRMRTAGQTVAAQARSNASWSRRIPSAITVSVRQSTISLRLSAAQAPHGRLYELRKSWRHPLYGDRAHWFSQRGRPFMQPAVDARTGDVLTAVQVGVNQALREVDL